MVNQQVEDICYSAGDIMEELEEGVKSKKNYQVGFSKSVPFSNAPPFFQAPPRFSDTSKYQEK